METKVDFGEFFFQFMDDFAKINSLKTLHSFKVNSRSSDDISVKQYFILYALYVEGCETGSELAELLCNDMSTISIITNKMVKNGLVEKISFSKGEDSRKVKIIITDEGKENFIVHFSKMASTLGLIYNSFDADTRDAIQLEMEQIKLDFGEINFKQELLQDIDDEFGREILQQLMYISTRLKKLRPSNSVLKGSLITKKEMDILVAIKIHETKTPSAIAKQLKVSESTVSTQLAKLEKKNMVSRSIMREVDSRMRFFCITENGEAEMNRCLDKVKTEMTKAYNKLSVDEQVGALNLITKLQNIVGIIIKTEKGVKNEKI